MTSLLLRKSSKLLRNQRVTSRVLSISRKYVTASHFKFPVEEAMGRLHALVRGYRTYGHYKADLDPLGLDKPAEDVIELHPGLYGFKILDSSLKYDVDGVLNLEGNKRYANIEEIVNHLNYVYCNKLACQFMHLDTTKEQLWVARQLETTAYDRFTKSEHSRILQLLLQSEMLDHFLAKKFPQTKRYGLEGGEAMIPALDTLLRTLNNSGVEDVVIGMPHRGRLNVMVTLANYPPRRLFHRVMGKSEIPEELEGTGDVLSHLGQSTDLDYGNPKKLHVSLLNNPSHLEAINPVAQGKARAKMEEGKKTACILIHGDAAFTGQGIVTETLALSTLPHYDINGTIHIILNNQLGFTTPAKLERSTRYSSSLAKMIGAPTLAVNGESIHDVIRSMKIAAMYREKFKKDVVVELFVYRRHGHNELDEPSFTQPLMYKVIRSRKTFPTMYAEELLNKGIVTNEEIQNIRKNFEELLETEYQAASNYSPENTFFLGNWKNIKQAENVSEIPETGYDISKLIEIGIQSVKLPPGFNIHPRLQRFHVQHRENLIKQEQKVDWATAETMAIGSLLQEGFNIRLSGQDVSRGTFSHRHMTMFDQETGDEYCPLQDLTKQGKLSVINSPLSELAVLGFEYGYSLNDPKNLCIWEAQFGDFGVNAQTIIDQFISSGEDKWIIQSGIVMILPHGFDGAGPEHSSARIERYLQQINGNINTDEEVQKKANMFIVNPTTSANYFHLLRRQMHLEYRKPLVIIGPKTLLKMKSTQSSLEELGPGTKFIPVLPDNISNYEKAEIIFFVSGKFYYELIEERNKRGLDEKIGIIRLEQLHPFPYMEIEEELSKYRNIKQMYYVQEEHENMGAYTYVAPRMKRFTKKRNLELKYFGLNAATAAVGSTTQHKKDLQDLMNRIFNL